MTAQEQAPNIPDELADAWSKQYGSTYLFVHKGEFYVFREITRREYKQALLIDDVCEREEEVVRECLLWPQHWKDLSDEQFRVFVDPMPAGIITALCTQILRASGCENIQDEFVALKAFVDSDLEAQMETLIDHVFAGGGDFDRYKNWSHKKLFEAYYRAEWMLRNKKQLEEGGMPQVVTVNGKQVDLKTMTPKQRQQLMMQHRVQQMRGAENKPGDLRVQGENGDVSLSGAVDEYAGGPTALQNMGDFMRKNQKFKVMQAVRKTT